MRRAALIVVLVLVWSATAGATSTYDVNLDGAVRKTVLVVGDSNIERGAKQLVLAFNDHPNAYIPIFTPRAGMGIRGYVKGFGGGDSTDFWQVRLPQVPQPDVVLVELGVNDTFQLGTATTSGYAAYGQKIAWLVNLLPGVPVLWTNLPCAIEPASLRTACREINWALALSGVSVVKWNEVALGHPEYIISGDVHLTERGYNAYAATVRKALDALP